MGLLSWIGRQIKLTDGHFWTVFEGGETWSGKSVTSESAMQISTFWSNVRLLSQTAAMLPLKLYEQGRDDDRQVARDHPLYRVIHDQPNPDQTNVEFWEGIMVGLCVQGNGYAEKTLSSSGRDVIGLDTISCVRPYRNSQGELRYKWKDRNGKVRDEGPEKVFHVRGFGDGGDEGLSPVSYARQTLGLTMATDEAAGKTYANGMRPGGFFTSEKKLTPEQRVQAKKVLIDPYVGAENASKIGILEGGFKWQDVVMNPSDAQMLQNRRFNVEDVCRWFGVPPIMVGHAGQGQTMWGTGVEALLLQFYTTGLSPYLNRIEKAIKKSMLSDVEQKTFYAQYTVEGLLRADSVQRFALYTQAVQNGIMTRNEVRAKEGLPRAEGADSLTVQAQMIPLEATGEAPTQQRGQFQPRVVEGGR